MERSLGEISSPVPYTQTGSSTETACMICVHDSVISKIHLSDILGEMKNFDKETLAMTKDFSL